MKATSACGILFLFFPVFNLSSILKTQHDCYRSIHPFRCRMTRNRTVIKSNTAGFIPNKYRQACKWAVLYKSVKWIRSLTGPYWLTRQRMLFSKKFNVLQPLRVWQRVLIQKTERFQAPSAQETRRNKGSWDRIFCRLKDEMWKQLFWQYIR